VLIPPKSPAPHHECLTQRITPTIKEMGKIMKSLTTLTAAAATLTAGVLGLAAPAVAAPSGRDADQTISALEAQGNRVVVIRQSDAPLDQASVVSLTRGPVKRGAVPFGTSNGDSNRSTISQTVYVTVK
jgi:hypothetical protein